MGAKEVLASARRSKLRLEALMERRSWYRQLQECHSDGGSEALARLQRELDRRIDEVAKQELAAMDLIDVLDNPCQRELLGYRYLNGWAWKEIAQRMGYSKDWVKHMHANAVRELEMLKDGE